MDQSIILPELPPIEKYITPTRQNETFQVILTDLFQYLSKQREAIIAAHDELARAINDLVIVLTPATGAGYTVTNVTVDRTFDADTVAVAELADIVGSLVADLKLRGIL